MQSRTQFEASRDKVDAVNAAEQAGTVADSQQVRLALMARVRAGEITLEQAQAELKRIQRCAKYVGQVTRAQVFSRG